MNADAPPPVEGAKGRKVQLWVVLAILLLVIGGLTLPGLLHPGPD